MRKHYTHTYRYLIKAMRLLVVSACGLVCSAQDLMLKNIKAGRPTMMFGSVIAEEDTFSISGVVSNPVSPYLARAVIGKFDGQGNVLSATYVYDSVIKDYGTFFNSLIKRPSGGYAYTGYIYSVDKSILIVKADNDLNTVIHQKDSADLFAYQGRYMVEADGNFYVGGLITKNGLGNFLLAKFDTSGQFAWQRVYGIPGFAEEVTSLIKLNNGNLMIGSYRRDYEVPI